MATIPLFDLSEGPLAHILQYIDAIDLARLENVCRLLYVEIQPRWKTLIEQVRPFPVTRYEHTLSPKERLGRWAIAADFAAQVERLNAATFLEDDTNNSGITKKDRRSRNPSRGRTALMLDMPHNNIENILRFEEYFIRFSYFKQPGGGPNNTGKKQSSSNRSRSRVVYEARLEPGNFCRGMSGRALLFDLNLENKKDKKRWPEFEHCIQFNNTHGYEGYHNTTTKESNTLLQQFSQHLVVTVVGMEHRGVNNPQGCWLVFYSGVRDGATPIATDEDELPKRVAFRGRSTQCACGPQRLDDEDEHQMHHGRVVVGSSIVFFQGSVHLLVARGDTFKG
jgi:hypothetical protein